MKLTHAQVLKYKSIEDSGNIPIDESVCALVGQNEAGKTAFLEALVKSRPFEDGYEFNVILDYPRKDLFDYEPIHESQPATVCVLEYSLEQADIDAINSDLGFDLLEELVFTVTHKYDGSKSIGLALPEGDFVKHLVGHELPSDINLPSKNHATIHDLIAALEEEDLNEAGQAALDTIKAKYPEPEKWTSHFQWFIWNNHIRPAIPEFIYFDEYKMLPGKINLPSLLERVDADTVKDKDRSVLRLLKLAGVEIRTLSDTEGYETMKARLEAISSRLTERVFRFWLQNTRLRVEVDIKDDESDEPPFNNGKNLYFRVRNEKHNVSVALDQRSRGFRWFFSFIAWFDSIKKEMDEGKQLIILLDEPGLSLHALAQDDFLRYIDHLAIDHQIMYTTHSPFMIDGKRLDRVRTVEDDDEKGTVLSSNVAGSKSGTLFPLQAALGYSIAQNLFVAKQNLIVEGISDLAFIQTISTILEGLGRESLDAGIVVTPVGGLGKVPAFVSLFGANELEIVVLHDNDGSDDRQIQNMIREKLLPAKRVINYALYRGDTKQTPSDVEDLFSPGQYIPYFMAAYEQALAGHKVLVKDLPAGDRIVMRINQYLIDNGITLRPTGGFNHYLVAKAFVADPPAPDKIDGKTLDRFEAMFKAVNELFAMPKTQER